ncbi:MULTISPECIES: hypothetical protein [Halobacillus]|nr:MULTISPECIES: hypothetical protein [Halobacillus]
MRLNMLMFTIIIERIHRKTVDQSIKRARAIEEKINDAKTKYDL